MYQCQLANGRQLALAALASCAIVGIWAHTVGAGAGAGYDFGAYLAGAHAVAAREDPYLALLRQGSATTLGNAGLHAHGYVYPPLLATLLALPLWLGMSATGIWLFWNALNLAAIIWMGYELHWMLRGPRPRADAIAGALACSAAVLLCAVAIYDLSLGQADLLLAALAVGACALWLRRDPRASIALAVAIAIKPTLALLVLVWLWKGEWRLALRALVTAVALVLLPFAWLGLGALRDYAIFLMHWSALGADAEYINQSPYGMLLRLCTRNAFTQPLVLLPWLVQPLRLAVTAGVVLWCLRAVPRARTSDRTVAGAEWLLALPLILLVSPLAEDIHYCLLLPTLVGLSWLAWSRRLWRAPTAWILWTALVSAYLPRMQELIYPSKFVLLGQSDPQLAPWVTLLRSGTMLYVALAALFAGGHVLRMARESWARPPAAEHAAVALAVHG